MEEITLPLLKCPDEDHPVSHAVHLARLAAGYSACVNCPHRDDSAAIPQARQRVEIAQHRSRQSLFRTNGIRGLYCNDLTREVMGQLGSAIASLLWEEPTRLLPRIIESVSRRSIGERVQGVEPRVVVGYDDRFSSPDLAVGLVQTLRRSGCVVIDIGCVHRPLLDFAVDHFHADAGCFVTGGGCAGDWNGLEIVGRAGITWSLNVHPTKSDQHCTLLPTLRGEGGQRPDEGGRHREPLSIQHEPLTGVPSGSLSPSRGEGGKLADLETRWQQPIGRPVRTQSSCRTVSLLPQYGDVFRKQLHALRPLRIQVASACPQSSVLLAALTDQLPGRMTLCPALKPFGEQADIPASVQEDLVRAIHREHLDLGFLIASDGRGCYVFDECGELLSPVEMVTVMLETGEECPVSASHLAVPAGAAQQFQRPPWKVVVSQEPTEESLLETQRKQRTLLAADLQGRFWRASSSPRCDALLTFANVLQFFSRSDLPPSMALQRSTPPEA